VLVCSLVQLYCNISASASRVTWRLGARKGGTLAPRQTALRC
jgi:hypothetical protein